MTLTAVPVKTVGQSEPVACGDPDVGSALLLDDHFDMVVDFLEAVAVHDGWKTGKDGIKPRDARTFHT